MQRMTALKDGRYRRQALKAGDTFEADPRHVRVLVATKMAIVNARPVERVDFSEAIAAGAKNRMPADWPMGKPLTPDAPVTAEPAIVEPAALSETPAVEKPKRAYTRRDMKAEP